MHLVQPLMEASLRRLGLLVMMSAWCVRQGASDQAVQMVHQLVRDSMAGCHVVLVVTAPHSPLLSFVNRYKALKASARGVSTGLAPTLELTNFVNSLPIYYDSLPTSSSVGSKHEPLLLKYELVPSIS